jgi:hypothetical protein
MALTQKQGHLLGKCLFAAAAAGAVAAFQTNPHHTTISLLLASSGAVVVGVWLHTKLYMSDPAAREEYKCRIASQPLSKSLKDLGVETILQLVDIDEGRELFLKEFRNNFRFAWIFAAYDTKWLTLLLNANVVYKEDLVSALKGDMEVATRASDPFTSVWSIVGASGLYFLDSQNLLPVTQLRALLDIEYNYPEGRSGCVATAPDDASCAGSIGGGGSSKGVHHMYKNISNYGAFCVSVLKVSRKYVTTMVQTCRLAQESSYTTLLGYGLLDLYQEGFAESHWCSEKLKDDMRLYRPSLSHIEKHVSIERQLSSGMISSAELFAPVFSNAIPISPFVRGAAVSAESNVVCFIDFYESLLASHGPRIVEPRLWAHVLWVKAEWDKACTDAKDKFRLPSKPRRAVEQPSRRKESQRSSEQRIADAAADAAEQQAQEKEIKKQKEEFLLSRKKDLHAAFCSRVANAGASANWF